MQDRRHGREQELLIREPKLRPVVVRAAKMMDSVIDILWFDIHRKEPRVLACQALVRKLSFLCWPLRKRQKVQSTEIQASSKHWEMQSQSSDPLQVSHSKKMTFRKQLTDI